jgi:hypothetical protein
MTYYRVSFFKHLLSSDGHPFLVGWFAMIPSANGRRRSSIGNLRCNVRNVGAIGNALSLTLSMEWHCAQFTRTNVRPRCADGDSCARAG